MDQPASVRVKNRRVLPDVIDYQLHGFNVKNSLMKVQQSQANGKTYISLFNEDTQCSSGMSLAQWNIY